MNKILTILLCLFLCLPLAVHQETAVNITTAEKEDLSYAERIFDTGSVHRIDIRLSDEDWAALQADPIAKTPFTADTVIDGEEFDGVTFSTKGNSSLVLVTYGEEKSNRYSFRINSGEQTYHGLNKLNLNNLFRDSTWMKDLICYNMFRDGGIEAPLTSYVWVTVNGEECGLYMAVEPEGSSFKKRTLGGEGKIYSVERQKPDFTKEIAEMILGGEIPPVTGVRGADLVYAGDDPALYPDILGEKESMEESPENLRMVEALRALSLGENLEEYFDMDKIIRFFAVHNFLLNYDSYTGSQLNNTMLYVKDGKLSLIPWDYNLAFGTILAVIGEEAKEDPTALINLGIDTPLIHATEDERPLWKVIRQNPEYLEKYHEAMRELLEKHLLNGEYEAEIDRIEELLLPWVEKDPTAFCSAEEFKKACGTLKAFISRRTESVRRQLAGELAADSSEQDPEAMVDASDLRLSDMGAL